MANPPLSETEERFIHLQGAYRATFSGPSGEITLEHLLMLCGVYSPNLSNDPVEMARSEGRRMMGLHILAMIGDIKTERSKEDA